ncbi:hypothetical protein DQ238_16325 [Geodermatophilus sp. TF02-6]|uniref:hypothetical protein n=1 Tax=Geodermatophilus sp. TF02-6 TaxID=2250575 RepID=UPI000DE8B01F|nr:hypothetical protein [Geodermatophilus sp. TF02-6]RBY76828.1 hypothetical protein DQ238_16325 [Geodermatophilus sp. TF02-6]
MTATQRVITDGLPAQLPRVDADETAEWREPLDGVVAEAAARHRLDDPDSFPVGISAGGDS